MSGADTHCLRRRGESAIASTGAVVSVGRMTPDAAANAMASATSTVASHFMLDPATYQRGTTLGFDGIDFYFGGRGGVLGPVDADVICAAFGFFNPDRVRQSWEAALKVMPPEQAAHEFAACAHDWGRAHLPPDVDAERLAALAGKVVDAANPAGAPIFAGWRRLPRPDDAPALAIHHMNALRELRGSLHVSAVLGVGLRPHEAVLVKQPYMAALFGWNDLPDVDTIADGTARHAEADARTDRAFGLALGALDDGERAELVELANALHAATS